MISHDNSDLIRPPGQLYPENVNPRVSQMDEVTTMINSHIRALVVRAGGRQLEPWWWKHIEHDPARCQIDYKVIPLKGGKLRTPASPRFVGLMARTFATLVQAKRKYDYVFTFECGWESFLVSFIQTFFMCRRPRHVILQFIMRERRASLGSRLKYALMRWCFSSVYLCICSSRSECRYYEQAFFWPQEKLHFVPLHTDPALLEHPDVGNDGFIISAGRTCRDYGTLLAAFESTTIPLFIVASPGNVGVVKSQHVKVFYDMPGPDFVKLLARSLAVVIPLEDRKISVGQSVLLQAMTLGKAVVVSKVNGSDDYIEHMKTGIVVPPYDPKAIREAVAMLIEDERLRTRLGQAAKERVKRMYLPQHYVNAVGQRLRELDGGK